MLALIMAGGSGTRFWPRSRIRHPKQLLRIHGDGTMIQQTVRRLQPLVANDGIFAVTNTHQVDEIRRQLPDLPPGNLLVEPEGKNTAPCIGLGAIAMRRHDPDEVMVVLPADHLIADEDAFLKSLQAAVDAARQTDALVTLGIRPTYGATGYGYIERGQHADGLEGVEAYRVDRFTEKPDAATAQKFADSGNFYWNSGIFVWKIQTILDEMARLLPDIARGLGAIDAAFETENADETIRREYGKFENISIDYGVMEHARRVLVVPTSFGWNDLGSWSAVHDIQTQDADGNAADPGHLLLDSRNCFVDAPGKTVALVGMEDLIVVDSGDALLICPKSRAEEVKDVVAQLKARGARDVL